MANERIVIDASPPTIQNREQFQVHTTFSYRKPAGNYRTPRRVLEGFSLSSTGSGYHGYGQCWRKTRSFDRKRYCSTSLRPDADVDWFHQTNSYVARWCTLPILRHSIVYHRSIPSVWYEQDSGDTSGIPSTIPRKSRNKVKKK